MNAVKVDEFGGIRPGMLKPGDYYESEVVNVDEIRLRRVTKDSGPVKKTREEVLQAIETSPLQFTKSWDELRRETRG